MKKESKQFIYAVIVTVIGLIGSRTVMWALQYGGWRFLVPVAIVMLLLGIATVYNRYFH